MNRLRQLFYHITGGRPMKKLAFAFRDVVEDKPIYYFTDKLGRRWLSYSPWSLFRVVVRPEWEKQ